MITIYNKQRGGGLALFEHQEYLADQQRTYDNQLGTWFCKKEFLPSFQLFSPYNIQTIQVWAMRNTQIKVLDLEVNGEGWTSRYSGSEWIITATDDPNIRVNVTTGFDLSPSGTLQLRFVDAQGVVRFVSQLYKAIDYECER